MSILAFTEHFNMVPKRCFSKPDNHISYFQEQREGFKRKQGLSLSDVEIIMKMTVQSKGLARRHIQEQTVWT